MNIEKGSLPPNMIQYGNRYRVMVSVDPQLAQRLALFLSKHPGVSTARGILALIEKGLSFEEARKKGHAHARKIKDDL
jgi:septation ring formation regulator EzrA